MPALAVRKRSGRPPTFTALQITEVKALACQLPTESGAPPSRWSRPELAREALTRAITDTISASPVRRWLKGDALKPWQHRSWVFIRDPNFRATAQRVLDLYARIFEGAPLARTSTSSPRMRRPPSVGPVGGGREPVGLRAAPSRRRQRPGLVRPIMRVGSQG
ncbi:helix-turn-helix domain-containing protein [Streptomyces anulatus]